MNHYMTTEEVSALWNATAKTVQLLCRQGKILGAVKRAGIWFIPENTPNLLKNTKANAGCFSFVGTKMKIFNNALQLFITNGYENVTVNDIAVMTGIRQSAIYNHFTSKQKILETLYDYYSHYYLLYRPELEGIEPILMNGSLLDIVKSVRYEFSDESVRQRMIEISILVFQRQGIDDHARELLKSMMIKGGIDFVETVLNRAIEIGRLVSFDTHTVSVFINIVRMYTLQVMILDPSAESIEQMLKDEQALYELAARFLTEAGTSH